MTRSLRNRVALSITLATALLAGVLFVILYGVVRESVYSHLDTDLEAESQEVFNSFVVLSKEIVFSRPGEWKEPEHGQLEVNPMFIQIVDSSGKLLRKSRNLKGDLLPFDRSRRQTVYYNSNIAGSDLRQMQAPIRSPQGALLGHLIIGMPRQEADIVLRNLGMTLIIAYPAVLIVLFLAGSSIAGKSIAPVNEIIGTAERITREHLTERIPLPPTEDELHRLSATINGLLDRLQDAVLREQQFTADAAHELLTPLASLKGTLEVLIRTPREAEYYVRKIAHCIEEVNRLTMLVQQLLMIARADSGTLKPAVAPIDLTAKVKALIGRMEPLLLNKNMEVHFSPGDTVTVRGDAAMVDQMLENILANAIKYSTDGQSIDIAINPNGEGPSLTITDHGAGITEEQRARIFDRFYRTDDSRSSKVSGAGLGLAIVKRFAELQHITISLQSAPSTGTAFTLRFPS